MCVQWSLLNQVLSVLAFSRSLRARVCSGCLRDYVLAFLTGPLAYVLIYRVRGVRPCLTCLLVFYPSVLIYLTSLSACVCACVCVCVCVCVFSALPPWRFLPSARCLKHFWRVQINNVMLWVSSPVLLPSSFISISENVNIAPPKTKLQHADKL